MSMIGRAQLVIGGTEPFQRLVKFPTCREALENFVSIYRQRMYQRMFWKSGEGSYLSVPLAVAD